MAFAVETVLSFRIQTRCQGGTEKKPNRGFYDAAGEPKQIWEVPNGQHIAGIKTQPAEYERRVIRFFEQMLLNGKPTGRSTP